MQGSFEKRVQEKLEELKLTPSEPVWKNIEKEIRQEKRRRFPFWIPFVIVLLAGTGWWLLSGKVQEPVAGSAAVPATPSVAQKENGQHTSAAAKDEPRPGTVNPATTATATNDQPDAANSVTTPGHWSHSTKPITAGSRLSTAGTVAAAKKNAVAKRGRETIPAQPPAVDKPGETPGIAADPETTRPAPAEKVVAQAGQPAAGETKQPLPATADSAALKPEEKREVLPAIANDTVAAKTKIAALKKGWRKTLTLEGGWSRVMAGGLFAGGARAADYYASPSGGFTNGASYGYPSSVRSGAAFRVGLGLSKALGNRWEFAVGLHYAQYSTRTRVGEFKAIDTTINSFSRNVAVDGYFRNSNRQDYTTRFHMLEVPVSLGFRPLPRLPLTISAGALYGRLLHTNALSFSPWGNMYYRDERSVQKNYFAGFSSLQFTVLKKANWQVDAGPVVQYHFSPLKRDSATAQHLSFAGLKTTFRF